MRKSWKQLSYLFMISIVLLLAACSSDETTTNENEGIDSEDGKIYIVTTIAQIGEPLSVIGGDRVNVESLMGPSIDPHVYNATQSDIEKINNAELIFYNGLNLEANMIEIFEKFGNSKPAISNR